MNFGLEPNLLELAKLAYISENWERLKVKGKTTRDIAAMLKKGGRLMEIIGGFISRNFNETEGVEEFGSTLEKAIRLGVVPVAMDDDEYPRLLREYGYGDKVYPPLVLYRFGEPLSLVNEQMVAVVGTRNPSKRGLEAAWELGRRLAKEGYAVVTGLASGIDEAATLGATDAGGRVVGVLPWLYDDAELTRLMSNAKRILDYREFTLVSEHLVKNNDLAKRLFALRNRIVSGMSILVIIPEAKYRNSGWGTRHQVEYGIRAKRKVLIMKPMVDDKDIKSAYDYFVKEGAKPVESIDEILSELKQMQDSLIK